jgi:hypothetical protein
MTDNALRGRLRWARNEVSEAVDLGQRRLLSTPAIGIATFAVAGGLFPAVVQQLASAAGSPDNELASLSGASAWLNSEPLTAADLRGKVVRLLDLHLHQLAAHAPLCARLGREIPGPGAGGHRRAHALR